MVDEAEDGPAKRIENLALGLALIAVGTAVALEQQGLVEGVGGIQRLWPVFLLAAGAARLAAQRWRAGVLLVGLGGIFLAANYGVLGWRQIWPLFLVLGGLHVLMRGLERDVRPRRFPDGPTRGAKS